MKMKIGKYYGGGGTGPVGDIFAEWPDDTAHIITHEYREYDLTALETPFGLLPEPVREALRAWSHGWQYYGTPTNPQGWADVGAPNWHYGTTYRAKPAPAETRVKCIFGQYDANDLLSCAKVGTCIKRADGTVDVATWEPEQ